MKKPYLYGLIAAFALQGLAISYMIWGHYQAQSEGKHFLFQTEPLDPRDYFRGQYVALNFAADSGNETGVANDVCQNEEYQTISGKIYAHIGQNAQGLAEVKFVSQNPPDNDDYVKINDGYCSGKRLHFSLPFNRYYANEQEAMPMEIAARENPEQTFLQVAIYRGRYAVEQLILPVAVKK